MFLNKSLRAFQRLRLEQLRHFSSSSMAKLEGAPVLQAVLKDRSLADTVVIGYTDIYGRLMGKHYDADVYLDYAHKHGTHACTYTLAVDMKMNPMEGFDFASWATGFGDFHLVPDESTLRFAGWRDKTLMVLCDIYDSKSHKLVDIAPRSVLRKQLASAEAVLGKGARVQAASELEYYLYNDSFQEAKKKGYEYNKLETAGWYSEDYHILQASRTEHFHQRARKTLRASGLPIEGSKGETGVGQHELNIVYSEALRMADRHVVFKQGLKEIAEQKGMSITFMAKPIHSDAGSSAHIHLSVVDASGKNLFCGNETLGTVKGCSQIFKYFLGGWLHHTPDLYVLYAPTINSYKRFAKGSWAPTACEWGDDNRTTGFRIVGSGESLRIECRLPGADVNPYLAFAAGLASGLDGIKNKIDPKPMYVGDAYKSSNRVPTSLGEAAERFAKSEFVKKTFGEAVQKHYSHFYKLEQHAFDTVVTDWERDRYFEQI